MLTFDEFQEEVHTWSLQNFGEQPSLNPLLGVIEEIGEYYSSDSLEDKMDSVADAMIYIADFAARRGMSLDLIVKRIGSCGPLSSPHSRDECCIIDIGNLCHSVLKLEQGIRVDENHDEALLVSLARIIDWCRWSGGGGPMGLFLVTVVLPVWDKVKQRDWKANKVSGVVDGRV